MKYPISVQQFETLYILQSGKCYICGTQLSSKRRISKTESRNPNLICHNVNCRLIHIEYYPGIKFHKLNYDGSAPAVDHNHNNGVVRSILCNLCNSY
ncbi:MAG: endonuclease domain-containing protein, partial [Bacillati bacterium]